MTLFQHRLLAKLTNDPIRYGVLASRLGTTAVAVARTARMLEKAGKLTIVSKEGKWMGLPADNEYVVAKQP